MESGRANSLFTTLTQFLCTMCLYSVGILVIGSAVYPGLLLTHSVWVNTLVYSPLLRFWLMAVSLVSSFFIYGFSLIFILLFLLFLRVLYFPRLLNSYSELLKPSYQEPL